MEKHSKIYQEGYTFWMERLSSVGVEMGNINYAENPYINGPKHAKEANEWWQGLNAARIESRANVELNKKDLHISKRKQDYERAVGEVSAEFKQVKNRMRRAKL